MSLVYDCDRGDSRLAFSLGLSALPYACGLFWSVTFSSAPSHISAYTHTPCLLFRCIELRFCGLAG